MVPSAGCVNMKLQPGPNGWCMDGPIVRKSRGLTENMVSFFLCDQQVQTSSEVQAARDPTIIEHHFLARRSVIKRSNQFQVSMDPFRNLCWKQQDPIIWRIGGTYEGDGIRSSLVGSAGIYSYYQRWRKYKHARREHLDMGWIGMWTA